MLMYVQPSQGREFGTWQAQFAIGFVLEFRKVAGQASCQRHSKAQSVLYDSGRDKMSKESSFYSVACVCLRKKKKVEQWLGH